MQASRVRVGSNRGSKADTRGRGQWAYEVQLPFLSQCAPGKRRSPAASTYRPLSMIGLACMLAQMLATQVGVSARPRAVRRKLFPEQLWGLKSVPISSTRALCSGSKWTETGRISKALVHLERLSPAACRGLQRHGFGLGLRTIPSATTRPEAQVMCGSRAPQAPARSPLQRVRHGSRVSVRSRS
jgi:hypothetical protein